MISVDALRAQNKKFTLGPLSFELPTGYSVLVGLNGAGKSTLMRSLVGLQAPTSGSVTVADADPYRPSTHSQAMRMIGYCQQDSVLPRLVTTRQAITYAAWLKAVPKAESASAVESVIRSMDLTSVADRRTGQLSGGLKRRVSIACALVHRPRVLVLDEPTAGLDPVQRVALRDLLVSRSDDCTVLVSTHLVEDVEATADQVLVLNDGALVFNGTTDELARRARDAARGNSALERGIWSLLTTGSDT